MENKSSLGDNQALVDVRGLVKHFPITKGIIFPRGAGFVRAVDNVSFSLKKRETLGLVGESGCGKSTIARLILRLIEATEGEIYFEGLNILNISQEKLREFRRDMQIIFQDPYGSLNPKMTVKEIIGEPLETYGVAEGREKEKKIEELLDLVGLSLIYGQRHPHEFSGGQRQRIGIARALALKPKLIICDEPVSALDVSIQAQIINLLRDLQNEFGLAYLFISHDLRVVKHLSNRVAVMYLGKIVELGNKKDIYKNPQHPYTQALISAVPISDPAQERIRVILQGDVPSPINPPLGCRFHTRCAYSEEICRADEPALIHFGNGHYVACHLRNGTNNEAIS